MSTVEQFDLGMLMRILSDTEMRYQDPKIEKHGKDRKCWRIRPYVTVIVNGAIERRRKPIILGYCDEMTLSQAKQQKQKCMLTVNAGKITVQAQVPFNVVVEKYRQAQLPLLNPSTQAKYRNHIDNHILPGFGKMTLAEIDKPTVQAWFNEKRMSGLAWATLNDLRSILGVIFNRAKDWRMWDGETPVRKIDIGKKTDARKKRILGAVDFARFVEAIPETRIMDAARVRLLVMTAVIGGLRVSEVLGLQGRDIDVRGGKITVERRWHRGHVHGTKTEASEGVVLIGDLAQQLAMLGTGESYLFARNNEELPPDDRDIQQHILRPAAERAGCYFAGFGMHTFRRMKVTLSQQAGASALEAQSLARHADIGTTMRYTIIDEARERAVLKGMTEILNIGGLIQ